ncbi:MAG TPA: ABC transporter substrate-binding protein [Candidatus Binatia bacterium]|jgi:ABC-type nitrate/sulfonate/bicarbonate transport system substrate-binding protein
MAQINAWLSLALLVFGNVQNVHAAAAPTKIVFGFAAMNARVTPLWAAKEEGFFAKNDIDGEPIFVRGAPTLNAALLSGDLQAGYTGGTAVMGAAVGGADFKIVAVLTNKVTYDLVARRGIKSVEELRGKQIGVTSIGGTNWMGTILGLERLGLEPTRDQINFIVAGDDSVRTQGILAGALDATAVDGVYGRILREKGLPILAEFSPLKIPITSASIVLPNAFIQRNRPVAEGLLKAILEGIIWGISPLNKSKVINLVSKRLRITPQEAEEGYKDMLLGLERKPFPSVDGLKNIQRLMKSRNPKMADLRVENLIDASFMHKLEESGFIDKLYRTYGIK